jgi:FAD/FMN-containing dehydrogenase
MTAPRDFVNWAGTVRARPLRWAAPTSVAGVQAVVRAAGAAGERVRVVGSGHSWSTIAAPEGAVAVRLDALDAIRSVDVARRRVVVEAGCRLRVLLDVLDRHGLTLPIVGSIADQTLAGMLATGTHGSSLHHGGIATQVRRVVLVDGTGARVEIGEDDPRLPGVRVHLGALGVVVELELEVVPAFRLRTTLSRLPFDEAAARLPELAAASPYMRMWWLAPSDQALLFTWEPTDAPLTRHAAWRWSDLEGALAFPALIRLGGALPGLIGPINQVVQAVKFRPGSDVLRSDHALRLARVPGHRESEVALPLEHGPAAMRWMRAWFAELGARADFIQEVRVSAPDTAWMSPAYGRPTSWMGGLSARSPETSAWLAALRARCRAWGGRPHWGKELDLGPGDLDRLYPQAAAFRALRASLDPNGVFRSSLLDRVLAEGPSDAPTA